MASNEVRCQSRCKQRLTTSNGAVVGERLEQARWVRCGIGLLR